MGAQNYTILFKNHNPPFKIRGGICTFVYYLRNNVSPESKIEHIWLTVIYDIFWQTSEGNTALA